MRPLVLLTLLAGCGFEGRPVGAGTVDAPVEPSTIDAPAVQTTDDASAALTPAMFMERLIAQECTVAFACKALYPAGSHPSFDVAWGTDPNDCVMTDHDYLARDKIAAAIVGGTITWDPTSAEACLAAPGIPTSCSALFSDNYEWADSCFAALLGHVADGGACTTDWECARGSTCRNATCSRQ